MDLLEPLLILPFTGTDLEGRGMGGKVFTAGWNLHCWNEGKSHFSPQCVGLEAGGEPAVPHRDTGTPLAETAGREVGSQVLDMSTPKVMSRQGLGHIPQLH